MTLLLSTLALSFLLSSIHGSSCNYFENVGFAEGYCIHDFSSLKSVMFTCMNESTALIRYWNSSDCFGDQNYSQEVNSTDYEFDCSTNDDSCSIIMLRKYQYGQSNSIVSNCKGSRTLLYLLYLSDYSVDCREESIWADYYSRTVSVSNGLYIEYFFGNDSTCSTSFNDNITITNGECYDISENGSSVQFTFSNYGGSTNTIANSNLALICGLMTFVVIMVDTTHMI